MWRLIIPRDRGERGHLVLKRPSIRRIASLRTRTAPDHPNRNDVATCRYSPNMISRGFVCTGGAVFDQIRNH